MSGSKGRVLVTGCAGYIGSVLCPLLLRGGYEVQGVDNLCYGNYASMASCLGDPRFGFTRADIRDWSWHKHLAWADSVIHLAALVGAPVCESHPMDRVRDINEKATARLCQALSAEQRLIYLNTNSGYGQTSGEEEISEDSPLAPLSLYGETKVQGEKAVLDHGQSVSLRLATVYGVSPRMRFDLLVNDWVEKLTGSSSPLLIYQPNYMRNFVHIRDVCRAIARMLADHRLRGVYNVASTNLSKLELAQRIAAVLGLDARQVIQIVIGQKDPDQRNCRVSSKKLTSCDFRFTHELDTGIREVSQFTQFMKEFHPQAARQMRNS